MKNMSLKNLCNQVIAILCMGLAISISSCDNNDTPPADFVEFTTTLSPGQEGPTIASAATGTLNTKYDKTSNKLEYTITYSGLTPTAMHFHKAEIGVAGAVEKEVPGPYSSGMTGTVTITEAQETDLLAGTWYLNIHTASNPNGEIRGQILTEDKVIFSNIILSGKEEVPSNSSAATGTFNGVYDKTTKKLAYKATITGTTITAMHLHKAAVGVSGPVIIPITDLTGETAELTADQETDLLAGNYYFNAHSAAFTGGEVRGQVVTDNIIVYSNEILGSNEVPATGSSATGNLYATYNRTTKVLSYLVKFTGITPTNMHFHKAAAGVSGAVVVPIPGPWTTGMTGSATLTAEQEADMLAGLWYINIHSAAFGSGEIRGQLVN